jgi:hypothetical protein
MVPLSGPGQRNSRARRHFCYGGDAETLATKADTTMRQIKETERGGYRFFSDIGNSLAFDPQLIFFSSLKYYILPLVNDTIAP